MLNIDSTMRQRLGSVLRTGYLRNILIASVCIAVVFPFADRFFIYPLFSEFVIENTKKKQFGRRSIWSSNCPSAPRA